MLIRADLHVHTNASVDGKNTAAELTKAAAARGLQAIAVCDHDCCTPVPPVENGVLLIPGVEITTHMGHVLGLFLQQPVELSDLPREEKTGLVIAHSAIAAIHACGGLAVLAHPFAPQKCSPEELLALPLDGVEVCNARAALKEGANKKALELAQTANFFGTGGSDAHCEKELGGAITELEVPELSPSALRNALLCGGTPKLLRACRWRFKGLSRFRRDRRTHNIRPITFAYVIYTALRTLTQK